MNALLLTAALALAPWSKPPPNSAQKPALANPSMPSAKTPKQPLLVRIDDKWLDLANWRAAHPAGSHWIDAYNASDATDVMYAFHSDKAMNMLKRLPESKLAPPELPPPTDATYAFRELRRQLVSEGWFKPTVFGEAKKLLPWFASTAAGIACIRAGRGPLVALAGVVLLAMGNTLAGWLAHDYVHGRSRWCSAMRPFGELVGGMSTTWWSMKHNMHHALTNEVGYDEDIALAPALYLWQPDPKDDVRSLRRWQHLFWPIPYSVLFLYWRFDSIRYVLKRQKWGEAARLAAHWAAFGALAGAAPLLAAVWLSGLLTATIVTVTHQSEEMFLGDSLRKYDFVEAQFRSTRNAACNNPLSNILWGGMQWQLEHHLFPTMPRYKYPALAARVKEFAAEQQLEYRVTGEFQIILDNVALLKKIGGAEPVEGNPNCEPKYIQV